MANHQSNRRTDEQLIAILAETGDWVVNGRHGEALCCTASLRVAIERAKTYASSGAVVVALCRLPCDNIIISAAQIVRLGKAVERRELSTVTMEDEFAG
jgi:2-methylisocitrate lyase-like PEP mutase family enzyme